MAHSVEDDVIVEGDDSANDGSAVDVQSVRNLIAGSIRGDRSSAPQQSPQPDDPQSGTGVDGHQVDSRVDSRGDSRDDAHGDAHDHGAGLPPPPVGASRGSSRAGPNILTVGKFEVDVSRRLPDFGHQRVAAYEAKDRSGLVMDLIAYVTDPDLGPNYAVLDSLVKQPIEGIVLPLAYDFVANQKGTRDSLAVIAKMPARLPLTDPSVRDSLTGQPDAIIHRIIEPIIRTLASFQSAGITHRRINPDNIFFSSLKSHAVLGECWMTPPGCDSNIRYETYECAMANPDGRGQGAMENDLFALGCLIFYAYTGRHLADDLSDDAFLHQRIVHGTRSLIPEDTIPKQLYDLIAGLLRDQPDERWTMTQIVEWVQGRRVVPPKTGQTTVVRIKSLGFCGEEISSTRHLSYAMGKNWDEATAFATTVGLKRWAQGLPNNEWLLTQLDRVLGPIPRGANTASDSVVSALLATLDPNAPIRYRDLSTTISGIPSMLLWAKRKTERMNRLQALLLSPAPRTALEARKTVARWDMTIGVKLASEIGSVRASDMDHAMDRIVYGLNQGFHCLSPILGNLVVRDLSELMPALEKRAALGAVSGMFIDFELMAFISAHDPTKELSRYFRNLGKKKPSFEASLDFFRFLAVLQNGIAERSNFPALVKAILPYAMPAIWQVRSRKQRRADIASMEQAAGKGQFDPIVALLMSRRATPTDLLGFRRARGRYSKLIKQCALLRLSMANVRIARDEAAGQFTMFLSAILSCILLLLFFLGNISWFG